MTSINEIMRRPIYEPKKRWHGGRYGWVAHRFPVKGGISMRDVMMLDMAYALYSDTVGKHPLIALFEKNAERRA